MKDTFLAAEHGSDDDDADGSDHDGHWEQQQIRKVVGAQHVTSVSNQVCHVSRVSSIRFHTRQPSMSMCFQSLSEGDGVGAYYSMSRSDYGQYDANSYQPFPDSAALKPLPDKVDINEIRKALRERYCTPTPHMTMWLSRCSDETVCVLDWLIWSRFIACTHRRERMYVRALSRVAARPRSWMIAALTVRSRISTASTGSCSL